MRVENSWGTSWGDSGYATLSWSFVNAYVDEAVSIGAVVYSPAPRPGTPPASTTLPTISGTALQGQTLSATTGSWVPAAASYSYQWQRTANAGASWMPILGATAATYTLTGADVGDQLRVSVTAIDSAGQSSAGSTPSARVAAPPPENTARPVLSTPSRTTTTRPKVTVGRAHVSGRRVRFAVAVSGSAGSLVAVASAGNRRVALRRSAAGAHRLSFSGRLSRGRWVVQLALIAPASSRAWGYRFVVRVGTAL